MKVRFMNANIEQEIKELESRNFCHEKHLFKVFLIVK